MFWELLSVTRGGHSFGHNKCSQRSHLSKSSPPCPGGRITLVRLYTLGLSPAAPVLSFPVAYLRVRAPSAGTCYTRGSSASVTTSAHSPWRLEREGQGRGETSGECQTKWKIIRCFCNCQVHTCVVGRCLTYNPNLPTPTPLNNAASPPQGPRPRSIPLFRPTRTQTPRTPIVPSPCRSTPSPHSPPPAPSLRPLCAPLRGVTPLK